MTTTRAIVATVSGRVQGVGYRYSAQRIGAQLGLDGWVMNRLDGTVRTRAQGPAEAVAKFIAYLHEGPQTARVTDVAVAEATHDPSLDGFSVRFG
jgi:acylphosphatase